MSAADLGQKRRCNACGMKFYDFKKSPITCPSCNAEFDPDSLLKSRRGRASAKQEEKAPSKADDSNDEFDDDDNFEDDDTLPSDDDGLIAVKGDDDDEMEEGTAEFIDVLDSEEDDQDGDTEDNDEDDS